jgi:AcrR family transcriptional regulator
MATRNSRSEDLERSVALLWGEQTPGRRGPKARLSVETIARAAIRVADADGLEALSMQRVAAELGYTTMSIYNHVPSKDLLLEVMVDVAAGQPPALDDTEHWRRAVLRWASELWVGFHAHPWMLRIPLDHEPMGPNQLAWHDRLLRHLLAAGLPGNEALAASLHLTSAVRGLALLNADLTGGQATENAVEQTDIEVGRLLAKVIDPQRFPALATVNESRSRPGAEGTTGAATELPTRLRFGLDRFLDGIESWVAQRARSDTP